LVCRQIGELYLVPLPEQSRAQYALDVDFTRTFGNSILSVRAPALLGAIVYVSACYLVCRSITNRFVLQLPIIICLTFNPLFADYMVAARGYGLADAFLLVAIIVPFLCSTSSRPSKPIGCVMASVALALSFTANFSFGFVDGATFLALLAWALVSSAKRDVRSVMRIVALCALPGLAVVVFLCGYPLTHWKREDLWWGSHSLSEMTESLVDSSLFQIYPAWKGRRFYDLVNALKPYLLPSLGIACASRVIVMATDGTWFRNPRGRQLGWFATALASILALSVLISWTAFHFSNLPLPLGRTGIYLALACTLVAAVIEVMPSVSDLSLWLGRLVNALLLCLSCYFLLCLRLTYFRSTTMRRI